jgi:hypothetical protein
MDHLLSPQAYVASASHYDNFFIRSYVALRTTTEKLAWGRPDSPFCHDASSKETDECSKEDKEEDV